MKELKDKFHFSIDDVFHSFFDTYSHNLKLKNHFILGDYINIMKNMDFIHLYIVFLKKFIKEQIILKNYLNIDEVQRTKMVKIWLSCNILKSSYKTDINIFKKDFLNFYKFINYKKLFSKYLRFHYYSEIFELTNEYKKIGIEGIFTTDKKEILYRFNKEKKRLIKKFGYFSNDEINFIKTQFRIENFSLKNLSKNIS